MISLHHRTIVHLQLGIQVPVFVVQRLTHNLPSVIIDEDNLWLESCFHKIKLAFGTFCCHINSLEPVILALILSAGTRMTVSRPSNPWARIDKSLIGMPFRRQQLFLLLCEDDVILISL